MSIQVTASISQESTKEREVAALLSSMQELELSDGVMVVGDLLRPFEEKSESGTIRYVPAYEFLSQKLEVH